MKNSLIRIFNVLGINVAAILSLKHVTRYIRERRRFKNSGGQISVNWPILTDYNDWAGQMKGHYFHQDLFVAQKIFECRPQQHIDVGSNIAGFVSHIATFMPVEILDIRPLGSQVKNISFTQQDVMAGLSVSTRSLSCLHTLEHFGLGRYNDPIDPKGHLIGFLNLVHALEVGGRLYVSFPIGDVERVEFNAHRVFRPDSILSWQGSEKLELLEFAYVDDRGDLHVGKNISDALGEKLKYGCGIYIFERTI